MMATTFRRVHSNGMSTWARHWDGVGWDYGTEPTPIGIIETTDVHHHHSRDDAQAAADRLAHPECDERCGQWQQTEEGTVGG